MMMERYDGVVVRWSEKGFGFLFNDEINRRVFFHISEWHRATEPKVGEGVTFELGPSRIQGKPEAAVNVIPFDTGADAFKAGV